MEMDHLIKANTSPARKWDASQETWMAHAASLHVPIDGTFELTARCNLRCKMCYVRLAKPQADAAQREKTAEEWIGMARQALEAGTLYLLLTGGEPLLHPQFAEIYEALAKMGFIITIYTNATLVDQKIEALFKRYPPMHVCVTLYGARPETYARVCGRADAFAETIAGLERLRRVGTRLQLRTTLIRDNADELDEIRAVALRYSPIFGINPEVHRAFPGVCSDVDACRLPPARVMQMYEDNRRYMEALQPQDSAAVQAVYDLREKRTGFELEPTVLDCLAGKASYSISWDGRMVACNTFMHPFTEPFREGFRSAWERLPSLFAEMRTPEKCRSCPLGIDRACPNCPPKLFAETGSFDEPAEYICGLARERRKWMRRKEAKQHEDALSKAGAQNI